MRSCHSRSRPTASGCSRHGDGTSCALFLVEVRSRRRVARRQRLRRRLVVRRPRASSRSSAEAHEVVFDTTGRRRFSLPGTRALWSAKRQPGGRQRRGHADDRRRRAREARSSALPGAAAGWSADGSRLVLDPSGRDPGRRLARVRRRPRVLVRGPRDWSPLGGRVHARRCSSCATSAPPGRLRGDSRDGRHAACRCPATASGHATGATRSRDALPPAVVGGLPRVEVEIGDRFGRNARQAGVFASDDHGISTLTWSANGGRLLYESSVRAPRDLWAVDADGSNLHQLTHAGPDASAPAWSADGMRLAYTSGAIHGRAVRLLPDDPSSSQGPDGSVQSTIPGAIAGQASNDGSPSWAPSGNRLVVGVCCSGELDAVGSDGNARLRLVPGASGDVREPRRVVSGRRLDRGGRLGRQHRSRRTGRHRDPRPARGEWQRSGNGRCLVARQQARGLLRTRRRPRRAGRRLRASPA